MGVVRRDEMVVAATVVAMVVAMGVRVTEALPTPAAIRGVEELPTPPPSEWMVVEQTAGLLMAMAMTIAAGRWRRGDGDGGDGGDGRGGDGGCGNDRAVRVGEEQDQHADAAEVRGQERLPCSSAGTHLVTRKVVQVALTKGAARTVRCTHCSRLSARQRRCWAVGAAMRRLALLRLPLEAPARRRWTERRMGCEARGCEVAGHRARPRRCAGSGGMHTAAAWLRADGEVKA